MSGRAAKMRRRWALGVVWVLVFAGLTPSVAAQDDLDAAVERARQAWLQHDVQGLFESDTVRLNLPGVAWAASLKPGQAARLLSQYLKVSEEREFTLREVRMLAPDHAYAEVRRRYAVRGTDEERWETAFLGFRLLDGRWQLREVRITP